MNYDILAPGLVYYKNAILNPAKTIETIELIQSKLENGVETAAEKWEEWNGSNPDLEKFCLKHQILDPSRIHDKDPLYDEICLVYNNIFKGIDNAFQHYSNKIYPAASSNIKTTEGILSILKYLKAGYLPPHQDQGVSSRVLSTVGYLNEDYDGGEIHFSYLDITIKPEAGSVVFFPSNFIYVHEVKPMVRGIRYAVPQWYHSLEDIRYSTGDE